MHPLARIVSMIAVIFAATLFSSCYKIYDYLKHNPGDEVAVCRVKALYNGSDTIRILYNTAGSPTDMVAATLKCCTWQSDMHFRYDKNNRIVDYFWANPGTNYRLIWHRYSYPSKYIVTDSLFTYINDGSGPNPPKENFSNLTINNLDADGRIIKSTQFPYDPEPYIINYVYNAKGNIDQLYAQYDNKLSIYHTNRVWMFLMKDYSVNNRLNPLGYDMKIDGYNAAGLPLTFTGISHGGYLFYLSFSQLKVEYECDK